MRLFEVAPENSEEMEDIRTCVEVGVGEDGMEREKKLTPFVGLSGAVWNSYQILGCVALSLVGSGDKNRLYSHGLDQGGPERSVDKRQDRNARTVEIFQELNVEFSCQSK